MSFFNIEEQHNSEDDTQWEQVKATVLQLYLQPQRLNLISDQLLLQQQNQLMEHIREQIYRSRLKDSLQNPDAMGFSLSNISSTFNGDEESLIKSKFTEEVEFSLVNSALKEVKLHCSEQAYDTIINYVINNKQKQCESLSRTLQKKNRQIEQLSLALILKQNQYGKLREEISPYLAKTEHFEQQKKKWKKKNDQVTEKEKRIHKAEMTLIFKEKLQQEVKKKSERLREFNEQIYNRMKQIETELNRVWQNILQLMQDNHENKCCQQPDPQGCWKKQLMKKCREKLLEERNLLKEEQKQLEQQYHNLQTISEQWKKLLHEQNQQSTSPSPRDPPDTTPNPKERKFKINSMCLIPPEIKRVYS